MQEEPTAQFLAVYGRRRVGKTFLIREYFEDSFAFMHTAVSPMELKEKDQKLLYRIQLDEFSASLSKYGCTDTTPIKSWFDAFHRLETLLDSRRKTKKKMVVFIDELPWLDTPRSGFLSAFEHFWNGWSAGKHNLLLIVCGSATTWMLDNLINSKGGLYGRTTREMHIHPFTLAETEAYFRHRGVTMDRYGLQRETIAEGIGIAIGGTLSKMLKALVKSDLVTTYYNFGESKHNLYYKLTYMFCLFYLGFVLKNPTNSRTFWYDNQNSPKLNAWRGLAFEDVCFVHQQQIRSALGIRGVHSEIYPWHLSADDKTKGAQIDMIIERADRVVNLCEMKFTQNEFAIDKAYDEKLRDRLGTLSRMIGKKNPQLTLVTTYGLKKSMYSNRIHRLITMENLFKD